MSTTNYAIMQAESFSPTPLTDNLAASFATGAGAQAQGLKLVGEMNRIVTSVATGAAVLPSVGSMEASSRILVVNDSPNSINVGAAAGEKVNGVATTATFGAGVLAVASGATAVLYRSGSPFGIGGVGTASAIDWRGAAIS